MPEYSLGTAALGTEVDLSGIETGLGKAESTITGRLGGLGSAIATGLAGATVAIGVAVGAAGAQVIGFAGEVDQAQRDLQAQFGVTEARAAQLGEVGKQVFANNFADSASEAIHVIGLVDQQLADLGVTSATQQQAMAQDAFALRDAYGFEIPQSIGASKTLMEEFGLTGRQSMDFITTATQNGLNASDDLLETITEYGPALAAHGVEAEQLYSIIETGAQQGVLGTDKIVDAYKELFINLNEGGDEVSAAFDTIGLDYSHLSGLVAQGSADWGDYTDEIVSGLNEINNPILRARLQTELFGTMAEDLGPSFTEGLGVATTSLDDMAGATDSLSVQYESLGAVASGIWRQILVALEPVGGAILDLANQAMPHIVSAFEAAQPTIAATADFLATTIPQAIATATEWWTQLSTTVPQGSASFTQAQTTIGAAIAFIQQAITSGTALMTAAWQQFGPTILTITQNTFTTIQGVVTGVLQVLQGIFQAATALMRGDWQAFGTALQTIAQGAWTAITAVIQGAIANVTALLQGLAPVGQAAFEALKSAAQSALQALPGIMDSAISELLSILSSAARSAASAAANVGQSIVDGIWNALKGGIGRIASAAADLVAAGINAAKSAAGIQSPSRLFADEVGEPTVLGIVDGILATRHVLQDALKMIVGDISETGRAARKELEDLMADLGDTLRDFQRDVLGGVADIERTHIDALDDLMARREEAGDTWRRANEAMKDAMADFRAEEERATDAQAAFTESQAATATAQQELVDAQAAVAEAERNLQAGIVSYQAGGLDSDAIRRLEEARNRAREDQDRAQTAVDAAQTAEDAAATERDQARKDLATAERTKNRIMQEEQAAKERASTATNAATALEDQLRDLRAEADTIADPQLAAQFYNQRANALFELFDLEQELLLETDVRRRGILEEQIAALQRMQEADTGLLALDAADRQDALSEITDDLEESVIAAAQAQAKAQHDANLDALEQAEKRRDELEQKRDDTPWAFTTADRQDLRDTQAAINDLERWIAEFDTAAIIPAVWGTNVSLDSLTGGLATAVADLVQDIDMNAALRITIDDRGAGLLRDLIRIEVDSALTNTGTRGDIRRRT